MPVKAPPPVAIHSWAGLYVGGHLGAGFSYRNWTLGDGAISEAGDAVMIGGQIGFNHQVGKWVIGVESEASWGNLKDESVCPDGINTCWTRHTWLGTVTGRIGYANNDTKDAPWCFRATSLHRLQTPHTRSGGRNAGDEPSL